MKRNYNISMNIISGLFSDKVILTNILNMGIMLSNIDLALKIGVSLVVIVYTIVKTLILVKDLFEKDKLSNKNKKEVE